MLTATGLVGWSLMHWHMREAFGRRLLALAVLLCILFPAVSISDDLWALHNPAETDILLRRSDDATHAAMHHQDIQPQWLTPFVAASFALPDHAILGQATVPHWEHHFHEAPASFRFFIRPPPVL